MLTTKKVGPFTIKGLSLAGIYTSLAVPELNALLDVGLAPRHVCGLDNLFLSHGHADHIGALGTFLGIRGLMQKPVPRVFLPEEIVEDVRAALQSLSRLQRFDLDVDLIPMAPGQTEPLKPGWRVEAFRTHHPVPSLGYSFVRKTKKLKPQHLGRPGPEIAARKASGEDLFIEQEVRELAYATDTLIRVLDTAPHLLDAKVLILECSFLDERKALAESRKGCHIHLSELLEYGPKLNNEHLVLMHFSQIYKPRQVIELLAPLASDIKPNVVPFVPDGDRWLV